jgi:ribosome modulation factor
MNDTDDLRLAFNQGSQARIDGKPLSDNPYQERGRLRNYWEQGWHDVDWHWPKALKPVEEPCQSR